MVEPRPETITRLAPDLVAVLADNPSPMTYWGTFTFVLGDGPSRVVIDPGPALAAHCQAVLDACSGARVEAILVTHAHLDHSGGAWALAAATGAPVYAYGDAVSGRRPVMQALADKGLAGGGEGVDAEFAPDLCLSDGAVLKTAAGPITALHTPGHMANHLSFAWRDIVFCGDLVMAWSSSLISPPDGDAAAFRASCQRLRAWPAARLLPAHGPAIEAPIARLEALLAHRADREAAILNALVSGHTRLGAITRAVYTDLPTTHLDAASRNTLAHLIDLVEQNRIRAAPELSEDALFSPL